MADIDIFGDEPVVSMEEKEPEDKEELKENQEEPMTEDQNEDQPEGQPEEAIVIPDEKVQDGGIIDDEEAKTESETALAVAETAVQPVEPAKPAEIEPYISETDTVQVFICVVAKNFRSRSFNHKNYTNLGDERNVQSFRGANVCFIQFCWTNCQNRLVSKGG